MGLTHVRGSIWNTGDNLVVNTLDLLPNVDKEGICFVSGGLSVNDGSGGWFKYELQEPRANHDGNDIIDPSGTGLGRGCWIRQKFFAAPASLRLSEVQAATAGQTVFPLHKFSYTPNQGEIAVYVNGTRLTPFGFAETGNAEVTIGMALRAGDIVETIVTKNAQSGSLTGFQARNVTYSNTFSGLTALDVQAALDEMWINYLAGGGGGGGSAGGGAPSRGTTKNWPATGGTEPPIDAFQVGVWADVTTKLDASTLPVTVAAPVVFTVHLSDGTQANITLPAGTYQHLTQPAASDPVSDKGIAMELSQDPGWPATLAGDWMVVTGGKTYLRVDGYATHQDAIDGWNTNGLGIPPAALGTAYPVSIDKAPPTTAPTPGAGAGPGDARTTRYLPVAPDVSVNVQDALHWNQKLTNDHIIDTTAAHQGSSIGFDARHSSLPVINVQDAIDAVFDRLFSGKAEDVSFDPTGTIWNSVNVQDVIEEASESVRQDILDLSNHINDPTAAHDSTAIQFNHTMPLYKTAKTVYQAFQEIQNHIDTVDVLAEHVLYTGSKVSRPSITNVDLALTSAFTDIDVLKSGALNPIAADIGYTPATGLTTNNVQLALDELGTEALGHRDRRTGAHKASAITFDTTDNGWTAVNVQTAIIKAAGLSFGYRGHLDPTIAWASGTTYNKGDVWTCASTGTVHTSWQPRIDNVPVSVNAGDLLYYNGTDFFHIPHVDPLSTNYIQTRPLAGINQNIVSGDPNDTALTVSAVALYTPAAAPAFVVNGKSQTGDLTSTGIISDKDGNLRQLAVDVPFDPTGLPTYDAANVDVQNALEKIDSTYQDHISTTAGSYSHIAQRIQFNPVTDNAATDVQGAVINAMDFVRAHKVGANAHTAAAISVVPTVMGYASTNVQDLTEEMWNDMANLDGGTF